MSATTDTQEAISKLNEARRHIAEQRTDGWSELAAGVLASVDDLITDALLLLE